MLKIGFVDYYLDNWHCNHYPGFLREAILDFFRTKNVPVPHEETLEVVKVIEIAREARKHPDIWYEL
ncbi:MAG: hypothetical protein J6P72_05180 [Firmicutes bacterium]|nr:hypothetical protein [Bacillota bacterium]